MTRNDDLKDLGNLPRESDPPPEVEERVVAALRDEGLIGRAREPRARTPGLRFAMAATVVMAALGGWMARGLADSAPLPPEGTREYLVLLSEPEGLDTTKSGPELVDEYRQWGGRLGREGRLVTARRLLDGGRRLTDGSAAPVALSVHTSQSQATGFFLIRAESWEQAADLVQDSPHLRYGGVISLREVAVDE